MAVTTYMAPQACHSIRASKYLVAMLESKKIGKKGSAEKFVPNTVLWILARMLSFLGLRFPNEKSNELNEMYWSRIFGCMMIVVKDEIGGREAKAHEFGDVRRCERGTSVK